MLNRINSFTALDKPHMRKIVMLYCATKLSEKISRQLFSYFTNIDSNSNGTIEFSEFVNFIEQTHQDQNIDPKDMQDIFNSIDINGNGKIEFSEWTASVMSKSIFKNILVNSHVDDGDQTVIQDSPFSFSSKIAKSLEPINGQKFLKEAFHFFDVDNKGFINFDDLKQFLITYGGMNDINDELVEHLIQEVDKDNDGKINLKEFLTMMQVKYEDHFEQEATANVEGQDYQKVLLSDYNEMES